MDFLVGGGNQWQEHRNLCTLPASKADCDVWQSHKYNMHLHAGTKWCALHWGILLARTTRPAADQNQYYKLQS